jgi:folate-dependent tRNA-U54 methylase TrmFO/GidA
MKSFKDMVKIEEGKLSTEQLKKEVKEIAKLTDINHHTEAKLRTAELMKKIKGNKYNKFIKVYNAISIIQDVEKQIPGDIRKFRDRYDEGLQNMIRQDLDDEQSQMIIRAL